MPIKLKTTPYLTKAGRNLKSFLAIFAAVSFAVIVVGWTYGYLRAYLRSPIYYNPLTVTMDNMRLTSKLLPPLIACDAILLIIAAWNLLQHWNVTGKLRRVNSARYALTGLTQSQVSTLERLGTEYIKSLLNIKPSTACHIWNKLKPEIISSIEQSNRSAHIDLNELIKAQIAANITGE